MTTLREAAQQALEALELLDRVMQRSPRTDEAITALRAALAAYDNDRVRIEELKAHWAEQFQLARETRERDRQQREYEEQRLAALAEPVQEPGCHVFNVTVTGRLHEWEPTTFAFALRDGKHALYTAPPQRNNVTETYFDKEKFAELIVKECALALDKTIAPTSHPFNSIGWRLKEYFGVSE